MYSHFTLAEDRVVGEVVVGVAGVATEDEVVRASGHVWTRDGVKVVGYDDASVVPCAAPAGVGAKAGVVGATTELTSLQVGGGGSVGSWQVGGSESHGGGEDGGELHRLEEGRGDGFGKEEMSGRMGEEERDGSAQTRPPFMGMTMVVIHRG